MVIAGWRYDSFFYLLGDYALFYSGIQFALSNHSDWVFLHHSPVYENLGIRIILNDCIQFSQFEADGFLYVIRKRFRGNIKKADKHMLQSNHHGKIDSLSLAHYCREEEEIRTLGKEK